MDEKVAVKDAPAADAAKPAEGAKSAEAEGKKSENMVPVTAVQAEREKRKASEADVNYLKGQVATMQAQAAQAAQVKQAPEKSIMDSLDKDGLVSVENVQQIVNEVKQGFTKELSTLRTQTAATSALANTRSSYKDFDEVAQFYLDAEKTDPRMAQLVADTPIENRGELVYRLGKTTVAYMEHVQKGRSQDIQDKINENALKPGVSGSAGGAGGGAPPVKKAGTVLDGVDIKALNNEINAVICSK